MIMTNPSRLAKEYMENGRLTSFPIIDAHAHMGGVYGTYMSMSSADEMVELMDRENIEMVFCSPHSALHDPAIKSRELDAYNVTIPYKKTVMPYLDRISPEALRIGAVNTVVRRADGSLD